MEVVGIKSFLDCCSLSSPGLGSSCEASVLCEWVVSVGAQTDLAVELSSPLLAAAVIFQTH